MKKETIVEILYNGDGYYSVCDYVNGWQYAEFSDRREAVRFATDNNWLIAV